MPTIQFSKNIRKRGRQFENSSSEVVRQMAKRTLRSLVQNTKVDKGVARSNWRVGIGAPTRSVIGAYSPYPKGSKANGMGSSETANAAAAIAAGNARINSVRGISGVGLKTAIFISNNTPYIEKAIIGGGVEISIREAEAVLRSFRFFVDRPGGGDGDI